MSRVIVLGTAMWTRRLAKQIAPFVRYKKATFIELELKSIWRLLFILRCEQLICVGVRPGQFRPRGVITDLACLLAHLVGSTVIIYWIGSDVMYTKRQLEHDGNRWFRWWYIWSKRYRHVAAAPWLASELKELDFPAKAYYFPSPLKGPDSTPELPLRFALLTYIPDERHDFYGGREIYQLAKQFPNINIDVVGGEGGWADTQLANLKFHGRVKDMGQYYERCVAVLRLVKHDAFGATVREALIYGRYVVYSYATQYTLYVEMGDIDALCHVIDKLYVKYKCGQLDLNNEGKQYVLDHLTESHLAERFAKEYLL